MSKIHIANMKVVKSPRLREPFYMKAARVIGMAAWGVHQVIVSYWFRILLTVAVIYGIMRFARISVEIVRAGDVLLRIR
jgi:hypothetical protein